MSESSCLPSDKRLNSIRPKFQKFRLKLVKDFGNNAGTNCSAAFTDSEAEVLVDSDRCDKFNCDFDVVAGASHFYISSECDCTCNVCCSEVELRTVACEEGFLTAAFFFSKNVNLAFEFCVGVDGAGFAENLTSFDFFLIDTTEEKTYVVTSFSLVEKFVEHFNACNCCCLLFFCKTNEFNNVANFNCTAFYTTCSNCTTAGDREYVFYRHKERLVSFSFGSRNVFVNSIHKFFDASVFGSFGVVASAFESYTSGTLDNGCVISGEFVLVEKVANVHINEFEKFFVVNDVAFVKEYNDSGNAYLVSKKNVLACLLKGTVGSSNNEDTAVHLSSTCDHVFNVVCVSGAVNVCVVTISCFVFYVSCVDCDTTSSFFGSVVNLVVSEEFAAVYDREIFCDSSCKCCFTVVNVTDSTNVNMGFCSFKFSLCHWKNPP